MKTKVLLARVRALSVISLVCALPSGARAEQRESAPGVSLGDSPSWSESVRYATAEGGFAPFTLAPRLSIRRGLLTGFGGYDSARRAAVAESAADVPVYAPISLRLGTVYSAEMDALRPSFGGKVLALKQERQVVDGAVAVLYRAEGFTEAEGEVELIAAVGRTFGSTRINLDLVYGQDPEGNERDGEIRLSSLSSLGLGIYAGMDARGRLDLAAAEMGRERAPSFDLLAGPLLAASVGPISLTVQGGLSALFWEDGGSDVGALVLAGAGTAL